MPGINARPAAYQATTGPLWVHHTAAETDRGWPRIEAYRYGIDLYHQGYFWEAHEAWEEVWRQIPHDALPALLLQALIQNSAAQLKTHAGRVRGAANLSRRAYGLIRRVLAGASSGIYMGLDVARLERSMRAHYGPLWPEGRGGRGTPAPPPRLIVPSLMGGGDD